MVLGTRAWSPCCGESLDVILFLLSSLTTSFLSVFLNHWTGGFLRKPLWTEAADGAAGSVAACNDFFWFFYSVSAEQLVSGFDVMGWKVLSRLVPLSLSAPSQEIWRLDSQCDGRGKACHSAVCAAAPFKLPQVNLSLDLFVFLAVMQLLWAPLFTKSWTSLPVTCSANKTKSSDSSGPFRLKASGTLSETWINN